MRTDTLKRPLVLAGASAALIALFFVLREHWGHALGLAPYLLLLACPLMHLFHHGGHGHQHGATPSKAPPPSEQASPRA
jgi:hypothetical protein